MAEKKRYYWLKFKEDFFTSKRIKKLRKISADCVIIYLKMQLKALKTNGYLEITGIESSIADEIALDIDEDEDKVQLTLSYLQACGLIEVSEDVIFLPYVQENTSSETAGAQRVREHRERQKALQCNTDVTQLKQNCNVDIDIDIEKDIELDIEKDIKDVAKATKPIKHKYGEYNHVLLTDTERERLVNDFGEDTTLAAIKYLDEYIEMKGAKYKNHNLAIRKWVIDAVTKKNKQSVQTQSTEDYMKMWENA